MCIAIAALIWLPGLKFPVEAGGIDYEEMVLVESGEDVTLSINLSKLNLPAGFEVGSCNWITDGETVSADGGTVSADGLSYTLRNVTKSQFVYVSISSANFIFDHFDILCIRRIFLINRLYRLFHLTIPCQNIDLICL